jgi:hypothetical protein
MRGVMEAPGRAVVSATRQRTIDLLQRSIAIEVQRGLLHETN